MFKRIRTKLESYRTPSRISLYEEAERTKQLIVVAQQQMLAMIAQAELERDQAKLERDQAELERDQAKLERNQVKLVMEQKKLDAYVAKEEKLRGDKTIRNDLPRAIIDKAVQALVKATTPKENKSNKKETKKQLINLLKNYQSFISEWNAEFVAAFPGVQKLTPKARTCWDCANFMAEHFQTYNNEKAETTAAKLIGKLEEVKAEIVREKRQLEGDSEEFKRDKEQKEAELRRLADESNKFFKEDPKIAKLMDEIVEAKESLTKKEQNLSALEDYKDYQTYKNQTFIQHQKINKDLAKGRAVTPEETELLAKRYSHEKELKVAFQSDLKGIEESNLLIDKKNIELEKSKQEYLKVGDNQSKMDRNEQLRKECKAQIGSQSEQKSMDRFRALVKINSFLEGVTILLKNLRGNNVDVPLQQAIVEAENFIIKNYRSTPQDKSYSYVDDQKRGSDSRSDSPSVSIVSESTDLRRSSSSGSSVVFLHRAVSQLQPLLSTVQEEEEESTKTRKPSKK